MSERRGPEMGFAALPFRRSRVWFWAPVVCVAVSVVASAVAAYTDFRTGQIPNWLTYGAALVGLVLQAVGPEGVVRGLLSAVAGMAVCGLMPFLLWRKGALGGGDLKLFVAIGALLGYFHGIEAQFLAYCAGALFALARLAWHGKLLAVLANSLFLAFNPILPRKWRRTIEPSALHMIRFGGAMLAGTTLAAVARYRL
jgi:prepilin peptidase CpaA